MATNGYKGSVPPEAFRDVKIAIIGGTGLYQLDNVKHIAEFEPLTPWGYPSSPIHIVETAGGHKVAFLARHGRGHAYTPTSVPAQANIAALKHLGVEAILAFSAVGSLRQEIKPRDFVIPDQIIDRTKGIRPSTFFETGLVAHAMFADPFDHTGIGQIVWNKARDVMVGEGVQMHLGGTVICMEGPAFSTRAESNMYRSWGGSVINMSAIPEAKLAREAEIAYQMVCMSTDYDCWHEDEEAVTVEMVVGNLKANGGNARRVVEAVLPELEKAVWGRESAYTIGKGLKGSMKFACVTDPAKRDLAVVRKLEYILPGYYS
ncbi:Methylthioadenosine phosphorylase [Gonapodya prolifera JEL478]|uniref:S-methyl-5'-thioadenosine phosphorylase n=1 Tax=Gonapodya prolifera (strain JEL478) TaxID=1344416 RepID=A0A139AU79_GONPJ|nr:Methylthioadenosine phosphorylase [Gonapodya prolifera JEL478]|eukprot:KXS20259.1 Methylthioadenosine phosphorylase [Gonapodya prolifera JEL478]